MNLSKDKVTEIFYFADNFCKEFYKTIEAHAKHFYLHYVCKHMQGEFPQTVSYNRFSYVDSTPLRVCKNKRIHNH